MRRLFVTLPNILAVAFFCLMVCPASGARAAEAMFTVSNIHVDAQGRSATVAQNIAFAQGRPKAWQIMFRRLAKQEDWVKQPVLNDTQLQRLVHDFTIANERRSTTRYVADLTYKFNPAAVGRVLRDANIAYAALPAKPILLIPLDPGFARGSPWVAAFTAPRFQDAVIPFHLPIADALDSEVLAHLTIDSASWMDISPLAQRVHATEAVLVLESFSPITHKLTLTFKRLGLGQTPMDATIDVPIVQTARATYPSAADTALNEIAEMWKQRAAVDYSQKGSLTADVRIASLAQMAGYQTALATVPNVTGVTIVAMNVGAARLAISYLGTPDQLRDALAQASLQLVPNGGDNYSLRSGPPPQPGATGTQPGQPPHPSPPPLRPSTAAHTPPARSPSHRP